MSVDVVELAENANTYTPLGPDDQRVVTDRYVPSTLAYQGFGRGMDIDALRRLSVEFAGAVEPDLVVLDARGNAGVRRCPRRSWRGARAWRLFRS